MHEESYHFQLPYVWNQASPSSVSGVVPGITSVRQGSTARVVSVSCPRPQTAAVTMDTDSPRLTQSRVSFLPPDLLLPDSAARLGSGGSGRRVSSSYGHLGKEAAGHDLPLLRPGGSRGKEMKGVSSLP